MESKEARRKVYGAYGSNMNVEQMRMRCPQARVIGTGILKNYRLTFRGYGRGVANVERKRGVCVPIVLWEITPECEQALDLYEGFPRLYVKRIVNVLTSEGRVVRAMMYVMAERYEGCPAEPSGAYVSSICQGYFANGLSIAPLKEALQINKHERECQEEKHPRGWWKTGRRL
jgi:gamma-glutamylcyclotransferase (GGCT)/AIG2-like uncharacterized protein YtfP